MERTNHIIISVILSISLMLIGTIGYMFLENWEFLDAMYMTVITLTTVGFGEVRPVSPGGRIFTIILIFFGVSYFLYVIGNVVQFLVEGRIRLVLGRRKLEKQIGKLKNHYIVCGYGRIGRVLSKYLTQRGVEVITIELDENRIPAMDEDGVLYVLGKATDEASLKKAGVERAKGLVAALGSDSDNVFLVLISKQLNPNLFVVSRTILNETQKTLYAAGADKVVSPYDLGARRMAHAILRPTVIHFLELAFTDEKTDIQLEEIPVNEKSDMVGKKLIDSGIRQKLDLIIIAIKKPNDSMIFNPGAQTEIEAGETMIAVGKNQNLRTLEKMLNP